MAAKLRKSRQDRKNRQGKAAGIVRRIPDSQKRSAHSSGSVFLYGIHCCQAALLNPNRDIKRIWATENAYAKLTGLLEAAKTSVEIVHPVDIERRAGSEAVHQGLLLESMPLPTHNLQDIAAQGPIVVLDQITDPHNVGAILRSASAFGAQAVVMTERHSPPLAGPLAKAASGALEYVPVILVKNLARALEGLADKGFWRIGLDGDAEETLEKLEPNRPIAIVLGAEGKGLRRLTRENCDILCRLSTAGQLNSLNVSNAAAVALHCLHMINQRLET